MGNRAQSLFELPVTRLAGIVRHRRQRDRLTVDPQLLGVIFHHIAGQANHPFDISHRWFARITEHGHIPSFRLAVADNLGVEHRQPQTIRKLADRMKSPLSKVGSMDSEGMRNGSTTNERSISTARMTGKNDFDRSTYQGSFPARPRLTNRAHHRARVRRGANTSASSSQMPPVNRVSATSTAAKSIFISIKIHTTRPWVS